ncbi:GDSL-type esterase/lipase family protein [Anaerovoracaceae bacterium 42-11]|nr:GDSL-type esterase/lipase family protein [Emergencia sp.]
MTKEKKTRSKKFLIFIIVLLLLVSLFFIQCFRGNEDADYSEKKIRTNISTIATFDYSKVTTIEAQIKKLEITEAKGTFDVTKKLSKDQYRKIFKTSVILGDSITEGLVDYGWLGSEQVFCKIGASIISGDDLFISAAQTYPGFAFCSFGMNDMGNYNGNAENFIDKYRNLIKEFKKISPDTIILVNGITPPSKSAIASNKILGNYKKFNNALKTMCKDMKLTYIDNTYIIEEHPEFYAGDGIHVTADYYPLWMNNMILKAGI